MKAWWHSKTLWFNTVLMPMIMAFLPDALNQFPTIKDYLPHNVYQLGFIILTVGNVVLRAVTTKPLGLKNQ